jgi:two-component system, cell cycle sensor histidine kinase and response regulator CckA
MAAPGFGNLVEPPSFSIKHFLYLVGALILTGAGVGFLWPAAASYLFSATFLPHLYCYLGSSSLVWTHAAADTAIGLSYLVISGTLAYLVVVARHEIPFRWLFLAFGVFIVFCGFTHFMDVVTIWIPVYVLSAGVKIVTATASILTAAVLPSAVPQIRRMVRDAKVSAKRQELLDLASNQPDLAQTTLKRSNQILEEKVHERTAELEALNDKLLIEIEERKTIEMSLAQIASIVDSSEDAIFSKDLKGNITSWNRGAERLYGYSAEEVIGRQVTILLPVNAINDMAEILKVTARGQAVEHYETVRKTKDGRLLDISLTVSPIRNENGVVVGASAIGRDITERTRAEEALRESEAQYRMLFESNPAPMWVYDRNTYGFLAVNDAALRHYGYSRAEFLSMNVLDIRPAEDIPSVLQSLSDRGHGLSRVEVWRHRKKDGSIIRVEITSHPVNVRGVDAELTLANDITERLEGEEKLRQSEERLSKAFRVSPMAVTITTAAEGRYIDVNDSFVKWMGYGREQVIGKTVAELRIWADPQDREVWKAQLDRDGRVAGMEARLRTQSGELRLVQIWAERIHLQDEPCFLAVTHDVTEARRMEEQFRQAQKMEAVGRLAGGVAHDFNNMLGVILGYSELAESALGQEHPAYGKVEQIRKAAQRAAGLTRQLLAFSRQQVLKPAVLNLNALVNNISKMLVRLVGEDVTLHFVPEMPLGSVRADAGQIEQILMNLAVNARDAMPNGGKITIETSNAELDEIYAHDHPAVKAGAYVVLSVSDTGCGMDSKTVVRIFEPFFTTKEPGAGTGLGLSTVYGIVQQSDGHIWVYSEPGKGTSFKIYLPRVEAPVDSLVNEGPLAKQARGGGETIMLVEDDDALRSLALKLLEDSGYKVLEASDPRAAIELSNGHKETISLLLTDVIMPVMSGNDLAMFLLSSRPEMKVLYISGYTGDVIARHGVLDPATHLLEKPFTRSTLLKKIREVLDGTSGAAIQ